jgi:hypothetical protein
LAQGRSLGGQAGVNHRGRNRRPSGRIDRGRWDFDASFYVEDRSDSGERIAS